MAPMKMEKRPLITSLISGFSAPAHHFPVEIHCLVMQKRLEYLFWERPAAASSYTTIQYENGGDMDGGATPDYDLTKKTADGEVDYTDFFNFALLDSIMDKHYASSY